MNHCHIDRRSGEQGERIFLLYPFAGVCHAGELEALGATSLCSDLNSLA